MISYEQVKMAMIDPPPRDLIDLYNDLGRAITAHPLCVNDDNPFSRLFDNGKFCISATSIQPAYVAIVLGKHIDSIIPEDISSLFFNIDPIYRLQYGKIEGKDINGCIYLIHYGEEVYDLKQVYEQIYS